MATGRPQGRDGKRIHFRRSLGNVGLLLPANDFTEGVGKERVWMFSQLSPRIRPFFLESPDSYRVAKPTFSIGSIYAPILR